MGSLFLNRWLPVCFLLQRRKWSILPGLWDLLSFRFHNKALLIDKPALVLVSCAGRF